MLHVLGDFGAEFAELKPLYPGQHDLLHSVRTFPGDAAVAPMAVDVNHVDGGSGCEAEPLLMHLYMPPAVTSSLSNHPSGTVLTPSGSMRRLSYTILYDFS